MILQKSATIFFLQSAPHLNRPTKNIIADFYQNKSETPVHAHNEGTARCTIECARSVTPSTP